MKKNKLVFLIGIGAASFIPTIFFPVYWPPSNLWDWFNVLFIPGILIYIVSGIIVSLIKKK